MTDVTPQPAQPDAHVRLEPEVLAAHVRGWLSVRYDTPIVRVEGDAVAVLAGRPLTLARERAFESGIDPSLIHALALSELPWFSVPAHGLRLWRQHGSDDEQVTVCIEGDPPFQVVTEHDGWALVRLVDGATGWVPQEAFEPAPEAQVEGPDRLDPSSFVQEALTMEGAPYEWGGTLPTGVDCSGLVQRSAWRASGVWLQRHSTAMLRLGQRVPPGDTQRGDVLVLRRKRSQRTPNMRGFSHVAIAIDADEVVHASPDSGGVVRERIDALLQRYTLLSTRRLGPYA